MRFLLLLLTVLLSPAPAYADTTVTVPTSADAILIEGYQPGSRAEQVPAEPCVEHILVPQPDLLPADAIIAIPCREHSGTLARITADLRERVVRYLPAPRPGTSPPASALVNVAVIAFSGQRPITLHAWVIGEHVTIRLVPAYRWQWGDGSSLSTTRAGRPYPSRSITHTYRRACRCSIRLTTTWTGEWAFDDGRAFPLDRVLTHDATLHLVVKQAPIRLTR
jgi:hypothetical protein